MSDFTFFADTIMTRAMFESLPAIEGTVEALRTVERGALCRAMIERDGRASWHAVAFHNLNGTDRPLASRISVRTYRPEDDDQ